MVVGAGLRAVRLQCARDPPAPRGRAVAAVLRLIFRFWLFTLQAARFSARF